MKKKKVSKPRIFRGLIKILSDKTFFECIPRIVITVYILFAVSYIANNLENIVFPLSVKIGNFVLIIWSIRPLLEDILKITDEKRE